LFIGFTPFRKESGTAFNPFHRTSRIKLQFFFD
jgi:hypothetical protein